MASVTVNKFDRTSAAYDRTSALQVHCRPDRFRTVGTTLMASAASLFAVWLALQPVPAAADQPTESRAAADPGDDSLPALRQRINELGARVEQQAAELQAQKASTDVTAAVSDGDNGAESALRFYGFADMGLQRMMPRRSSALNGITPSKETTFVLGNINLYMDAQPSRDWGALVELRFTNYPNGAEIGCGPSMGNCRRQNTDVYDTTSASGGWSRVRWGSVVLERAYLEWHRSDLFTVRAGSFLTPFGIWNIDHGTPTLISLMLPQFEVNELFPLRQLGVEVLGNLHRGPWELGYFAYVSNGRTSAEVDFTDDKMLGGRLYAVLHQPFRLAFGLSGLAGRYSDQERMVASLLPYKIRRHELVAYWEQAGGVDFSLDVGALRVRSEFAIRRVAYDQGKRDLNYGQPGVYNPDRLEWDNYWLFAYQLPWAGLEPFVYMEIYRLPTFVSEGVLSPSVGFNIHFTASAQLKTQYSYGKFADLPDITSDRSSSHNYHLIGTRLVLAY